MTETSTSLSSQLSSLIDISRQTLEEVRNLEKLLRDLVSNAEKHRCLTIEELLSHFIRKKQRPSITLDPPLTKP